MNAIPNLISLEPIDRRALSCEPCILYSCTQFSILIGRGCHCQTIRYCFLQEKCCITKITLNGLGLFGLERSILKF